MNLRIGAHRQFTKDLELLTDSKDKVNAADLRTALVSAVGIISAHCDLKEIRGNPIYDRMWNQIETTMKRLQ